MNDPARTLALCALLAPGGRGMPGYADADPDLALLQRTIAILPAGGQALATVLAALPPDFGADDIASVEHRMPLAFDRMLEVVLGAYTLSRTVRAALGYDGQQALSLPRDGFGAEELAMLQMERPPRWRDPRLSLIPASAEAAPMTIETYPARHVANRLSRRGQPYGAAERAVLDLAGAEQAGAEIMSWPGYRPTPLVALPGLAGALGVGSILYKDEGHRFGLGSFKAIGGAYAVLRFLQKHLAAHGIHASAADLVAGHHRDAIAGLVVTTATDGNHGRSVAWGARMFGCRSVVFIHENVSEDRERAIAGYGAEMRRVPGGYDDSVRAAAETAEAEGWMLVADTNSEGGDEAPRLVMQGYMLIGREIMNASGAAPTHLFVQAGVGGLAAALAAYFWESLGAERPRIVVVEPILADCIFQAAEAGRVVTLEGSTETFMACLAAGEASPLAWTILEGGMDDVLALPDEAAMSAMGLLADGVAGDPALVAGESGAAALAGLIAAMQDSALRETLGLGPNSRVVVIGSEGATDPSTYARVVGRTAEAVAAAG